MSRRWHLQAVGVGRTISLALCTACHAPAYDDLVPTDVQLVEHTSRACLPPQRPLRYLWGVEGTELVIEGQLVPLDEEALAISAAGQELRLWTVDQADQPILRVASGLVDSDNRFELAFTLPDEVAEGELQLGLELARGRIIHPITAYVRPEYAHDADLLCAYFSDLRGTMLTEARVGQELLLVAQSYGSLPAGPQLDVVMLAPDARVSGLVYRADLPPTPEDVNATVWTASVRGTAEANLALQAHVDDPQGWMLPQDGFFTRSPTLLVVAGP
jgi:hypothetical protein